jgi:hypothetical protein
MPEKMTIFDASLIADGEFAMTGLEATAENYFAAMQILVDTGVAWQLPGHVGREAMALAKHGYITIPGRD